MTAGERLRQLKHLRESRNGDLRLTTAPAVSASHVAAAAANSAVSSPSPTFSPSRWVPTPHVAVYVEEPQGNMWKLIADQKNKEYTARKNLERETREANIKDQCEVLRQQMADRQNRAAARKEEALVFRSQIDLDKMKWDGELAAAAKERRNRAERVVRELNDQQADRQRRKEENARMLEMENQLLAKQIEGFRLEAEQQAARERREKELVKEDLDRANQAQLDELKRRKEAEIRYNLQLDEEQRQKEATDAARKAKQLADLRLKQMKQDSMSSHMKAVADDKERAEEARARAEYERIEAAKIEKEITDRKRKKESLEKVLRLQALQIREKQLRADDECRRKQLENEEVETLLRAADEANRSEKRMRHDNSLKQHRSITAQINSNTKKQWLVMSVEEQRINRKALERALGTRSMTPGTRMSLSPF